MPPHIVRYPPIQCNTRERCDQLQIPAAPPAWRVPEGPDNLAAAPMGDGGAWPGFEATHNRASAAGVEGVGGSGRHGCGARGRRRGLAGLRDDAPSEARSADGSRAGRRPRAHQAARPSKAHHAGGRTRRCPEHQRRHKQRAPDTRKPRPADAGRGQPTQSGGKV